MTAPESGWIGLFDLFRIGGQMTSKINNLSDGGERDHGNESLLIPWVGSPPLTEPRTYLAGFGIITPV
jgi:hypothetical protein